MEGLGEQVTALVETDVETFTERVAEEARTLKAELEMGTFDNPQAILGMEYEFYGVEDRSYVLRRVPKPLLNLIGFEKELGLHNAEFPGTPQPFVPHGVAAIQHSVQAAAQTAHAASTRAEHIQLVSDGFWTIPPTGESATEYLGASVEQDGIVLSPNISDSVRYHAMSNSQTYEPARIIDAPNVDFRAKTIMPATLATSIQPHYQVPVAADLPQYFRYVLRIAGPLLALAGNSPLFPPSLYDDGTTVDDVLATGRLENRVFVYESVMNDPAWAEKVTFPRDFEDTAEAVDRLVADPPISATLLDDSGRFDAQFAHICYKHGSYWRWARPVFEGATKSAANARIEFRPLPAQPTVRDSVALLAAFAGVLQGLCHYEHPVASLPWGQARENFYAAARDGLDADMVWLTANGEETSDTDELYGELFDYAQWGLERRGFDTDTARAYLRPLRERIDRETTPATWKRDRLQHHADRGSSLSTAVVNVQRDYIRQQAETLVDGLFTDWPGV